MEFIRKLNINNYEDFKKVFQVFEEEPFFEAWTEEEYREEFIDFIENGTIYGIYIDNIIWGIITIKPQYLKWQELNIDVNNSIYISDIAVCREARNQGLATKLMNYIVENYGENFDLYMRTNLENSMSEGIARKKGFKVIDDKVQEVSFKRTRLDIPSVDKRKYLIRIKNK